MCRVTSNDQRAPILRKHSLLLTKESFESKDGAAPTKVSTFATMAVIIALLFAVEHVLRVVLAHFQHLHELLEIETNRMILARHIGVDTACLSLVAYLGLKGRALCKDLISHGFRRSNSMPEAGYESRMYTYHPEVQQLLLVFLAYQIKNLYDTIVWNDGVLFIFHHIFAGSVAWGSMYPGCGQFYGMFYMGISEISTAILCVLANFDEEHGVPGLGDAFPTAKVVIAVLFVIAFLICRVIIWPYVSFHYTRDALNAIKSDTPQSRARKSWLWFFVFSLCGLTLLQMAWLVEIIVLAREEVMKM